MRKSYVFIAACLLILSCGGKKGQNSIQDPKEDSNSTKASDTSNTGGPDTLKHNWPKVDLPGIALEKYDWLEFNLKGKIKSYQIIEYYLDKKGNKTEDVTMGWQFNYFINSNNQLIKKTKYDEGEKKTLFTFTYEYDKKGRLVEIKSYDSKNALLETENYSYDEKDRVNKYTCFPEKIMEGQYNPHYDYITYDYDEEKNMITEKGYLSDALQEEKVYTYDDYGNLIEEQKTTFDKNGKAEKNVYSNSGFKIIYKYDSNRNVIEKKREALDKTSSDTQISYYTYNEKGDLMEIKKTYTKGAPTVVKYSYVYDEKGNLVEDTYVFEGSPKQTSKYTYDKNQNIVTHTYYKNNEPKTLEEYVIKYY